MNITIDTTGAFALVDNRYRIDVDGTVQDTEGAGGAGDIPEHVAQVAQVAEMVYQKEHMGMGDIAQVAQTIDMADVCELAHALTENECNEKGINLIGIDIGEDSWKYLPEAQGIYNYYYTKITETLNV